MINYIYHCRYKTQIHQPNLPSDYERYGFLLHSFANNLITYDCRHRIF